MHVSRTLPLRTIVTILVAVLLGAATIASAETARGTVFHDKNGNGVRDAGEPGVKGVAVSNGRDVVATDRRGNYALEAGDDTVLFVIKPSGWSVPLDENNVPQFYYVHIPAGSPKLKHAGVAPTGPLPETINFPLIRHAEPDRFTVLMFGDTQARNQQEVDFLAHDIVEELAGADAAFAVTLGDNAFNGLDVFEPLAAAMGHLGVPVYYTVGNHDTNQDVPDDVHSMETWKRCFGPPYYAFNYGDVHFIAMESVDWHGDGYACGISDDQLAFIRNDLALVPRNRLVVMLMHIPITELKQKAEVFALLAEYPHTFSASAHWHTQIHFFLDGTAGWPGADPHHHLVHATACGGWWSGWLDEFGIPHATMADGAPNGYSIITFDGNEYSIRFKAPRRSAEHQMNIHVPEAIAQADAGSTEVVVNVFGGSERSAVEMRVGDSGEWVSIPRVSREDPAYLWMKEFEKALPESAGRKLPEPAKCSHIWVGNLPSSIPKGSHAIQVRTTDMFGQTYAASRIIRIE